ncbi:4-hydroxythreonine-4-phosphate dehydrogenase PdxA, partial [Bacteroides ovatus]
MEDNKIRIGITQGDINGVGYEVILKTFSDPTMLELCTPIIYGSPKVAAYHRKALD